MSSIFLSKTAQPVKVGVSAWRPLAAALAVLFVCGSSHVQAQSQSMEERLRAQLRITTSQLQQAQNELAVLKGGNPSSSGVGAVPTAPNDVEKLKKDLERSQTAERQAREKLSGTTQQSNALVEKANAQLAQYRGAYDELLKLARASESERQRLTVAAGGQQDAVKQCEAKNTQLYAAGVEILHAYETLDMGTVMSARQPFAAQSRVKLEQIAQQYGDKLYEGRFDARGSNAPAANANEAASSEPQRAQ